MIAEANDDLDQINDILDESLNNNYIIGNENDNESFDQTFDDSQEHAQQSQQKKTFNESGSKKLPNKSVLADPISESSQLPDKESSSEKLPLLVHLTSYKQSKSSLSSSESSSANFYSTSSRSASLASISPKTALAGKSILHSTLKNSHVKESELTLKHILPFRPTINSNSNNDAVRKSKTTASFEKFSPFNLDESNQDFFPQYNDEHLPDDLVEDENPSKFDDLGTHM
jgi:hypothetical protein